MNTTSRKSFTNINTKNQYKTTKKYQKKRAMRNKFIYVCFFSIIFITIVCCLLFSTNAEESTQPKTKYFTSISVNDGDNLWKIAETYYTDEYDDYYSYIEEIKSINNMKDDNIKKGSYIIIPYYSE